MVTPVRTQIPKLPARLPAPHTQANLLPPSAPSYAPRNARIPSALNSLRTLPVTTGVYLESVPEDCPSGLQTCQLFCLHRLGASLSSLCAFFCARFLCFQSFAASFCKTPGVGYPECNYGTPGVARFHYLFRYVSTPKLLLPSSYSANITKVQTRGAAGFAGSRADKPWQP